MIPFIGHKDIPGLALMMDLYAENETKSPCYLMLYCPGEAKPVHVEIRARRKLRKGKTIGVSAIYENVSQLIACLDSGKEFVIKIRREDRGDEIGGLLYTRLDDGSDTFIFLTGPGLVAAIILDAEKKQAIKEILGLSMALRHGIAGRA